MQGLSNVNYSGLAHLLCNSEMSQRCLFYLGTYIVDKLKDFLMKVFYFFYFFLHVEMKKLKSNLCFDAKHSCVCTLDCYPPEVHVIGLLPFLFYSHVHWSALLYPCLFIFCFMH